MCVVTCHWTDPPQDGTASGVDGPAPGLKGSPQVTWFWVWGLGFGVSSFGVRFSGFGFRVSGFGFRVWDFGFRVSYFRFRVSSFRLRVSGFRFRLWLFFGVHMYFRTISTFTTNHFGCRQNKPPPPASMRIIQPPEPPPEHMMLSVANPSLKTAPFPASSGRQSRFRLYCFGFQGSVVQMGIRISISTGLGARGKRPCP